MKDVYVQQRRTKGSVIGHHSFSVYSIFNKNPSFSSSHITCHPPLHKPRLIPNQRSQSCLQLLSTRFLALFSFFSPTPVRRASFSPLPRSPCLKAHFTVHLLLLSFFASPAADHQRSPTPPPPTACGSQTTSPACLCLSSLSLSLYTSSLSTQFTFSPPPHLVTMETPGQYRDKLTLANKE